MLVFITALLHEHILPRLPLPHGHEYNSQPRHQRSHNHHEHGLIRPIRILVRISLHSRKRQIRSKATGRRVLLRITDTLRMRLRIGE